MKHYSFLSPENRQMAQVTGHQLDMFIHILTECLIKKSNLRLNPFVVLALSRTSKDLRQSLILHRTYNKWTNPNCLCNKCKKRNLHLLVKDSFNQNTIAYKNYLSRFFASGLTFNEAYQSDLTAPWQSYVTQLDGRNPQKIFLEMIPNSKHSTTVKLFLPDPVVFKYSDDGYDYTDPEADNLPAGRRAYLQTIASNVVGQLNGNLTFISPENIQDFTLDNPRGFVNWNDFRSLTILHLNFLRCTKKFVVGHFPLTLESLFVSSAQLSGSFENHTALKHLSTIECSYLEDFEYPASLETLISNYCKNLDLLSNLKCFAHVFEIGYQTSFALPNNLEIYVQYPFGYYCIDRKELGRNATPFFFDETKECYSMYPIGNMTAYLSCVQSTDNFVKINVKFPHSLRTLSAFTTFEKNRPQTLPNLVELHTFCICAHGGTNVSVNTLDHIVKNKWYMPKLRVLHFTDVNSFAFAFDDSKSPCKPIEEQAYLKNIQDHGDLLKKTLVLVPDNLHHVVCTFPIGTLLCGFLPYFPTAQNTTIHLYKNFMDFKSNESDLKDSIYSDLVDPGQGKYIFDEPVKCLKAFLTVMNLTLQENQHISVTRCGLLDLVSVSKGPDGNKFTYTPKIKYDNKF
jgi:hypothetical protein